MPTRCPPDADCMTCAATCEDPNRRLARGIQSFMQRSEQQTSGRLTSQDHALQRIEGKLDAIDTRVGGLERSVDGVQRDMAGLKAGAAEYRAARDRWASRVWDLAKPALIWLAAAGAGYATGRLSPAPAVATQVTADERGH